LVGTLGSSLEIFKSSYNGEQQPSCSNDVGKDATEECDMMHKRNVIQKYGIKQGMVKNLGKFKK
jgi:hypothetical protein